MSNAGDFNLKPRRPLLWLHRIGYLTTALVATELLAVGFFETRGLIEQHQLRDALIEDSRTHEGPMVAEDDAYVRATAVYMLGRLPPLNTLHRDGLKFVAMPSFNRSRFAIAIYLPKPDAAEAQGVIARFDQQKDDAFLGQRQFRMPARAYRSMVAELDRSSDNWPGDSSLRLDGTPTAFERVRGRHVTSGIGNNHHYDEVASLVWVYMRRFAPGDDLPPRGDWHPES